jgi:hypothetical protein
MEKESSESLSHDLSHMFYPPTFDSEQNTTISFFSTDTDSHYLFPLYISSVFPGIQPTSQEEVFLDFLSFSVGSMFSTFGSS